MGRDEIIRTLIRWSLIGCVLLALALIPLIVPAEILTADKTHGHSHPHQTRAMTPYKRLSGG